MNILVTNDDGFQSPSLPILCAELNKEHKVKLVVPTYEQSAVGQAISLHKSMTYQVLEGYEIPSFKLDGSPSDCVKFSVCHLFKNEKIDLVISGINPCENAGLSALYSGTVAGAREGATWGIPAIAISVWDGSLEKAKIAAKWLVNFLQKLHVADFPKGVFWNINSPNCEYHDVAGVRIASMGEVMFKDHYVEYITPRKVPEYWLAGVKCNEQFLNQTDDYFLSQNYITITPLQINQTSWQEMKRLEQLQSTFDELPACSDIQSNIR